ncbi:MAG: hypothetical protein CME62_06690 [Halobacteriovoraceae bacterium]|nr:hypothetical protein [Halobacteriovoraceae bacterium]|tara:strand:+ start:16947 stop:17351 length:405 start_codon:yes stop_codon:yes gene_type:complete
MDNKNKDQHSLEHLDHKIEKMFIQLQDLLITEAQLLKTEITSKSNHIKKAGFRFFFGITFCFFGIGALIIASILALSLYLTLFESALIICSLLLISGGVLLNSGRRALKMTEIKPKDTLKRVQKNAKFIQKDFA